MVVEFGRDELHLSPEQLVLLEKSVHDGNISSVMRSFEVDMKAPIQSMLFGSMLRSVFIQIQKVLIISYFKNNNIRVTPTLRRQKWMLRLPCRLWTKLCGPMS
jgi:hypothetical protein